MCDTCGLSLPPWSGIGAKRRYCTDACRLYRHRYERARKRILAVTEAAMRSEVLERPDLAEQEWINLGRAIERWTALADQIRAARADTGLDVPADWPYQESLVVEA